MDGTRAKGCWAHAKQSAKPRHTEALQASGPKAPRGVRTSGGKETASSRGGALRNMARAARCRHLRNPKRTACEGRAPILQVPWLRSRHWRNGTSTQQQVLERTKRDRPDKLEAKRSRRALQGWCTHRLQAASPPKGQNKRTEWWKRQRKQQAKQRTQWQVLSPEWPKASACQPRRGCQTRWPP